MDLKSFFGGGVMSVEKRMVTREEVLQYGLSFESTYQGAPFHDSNWILVRCRKKVVFVLVCCLMLCNIFYIKASAIDYSEKKYDKTRWTKIKEDYLDSQTNRLIFVKYKGGSNATVEMWEKVVKEISISSENTETDGAEDQLENTNYVYEKQWKKIVSCKAYVGQNGLNKKIQGDRKTPTGIYNITMAFGRRKSPGTAGISYTKLNKYHYWSTEKATYNTFVDVRTLGRTQMSGEHLISYDPWYNYALALDYNKKCTYLKGSAIFLHCVGGGRKYTMGCIAVSEKNMKQIVKNTTKNTKICIFEK
ncbi:MAG: L,D-transpeptidase family protein [Lachnospiraceae bacterium]